MTFNEFSKAIRKDDRLMELLNRCDRSCEPMSDEDIQEMIDRADAVMSDGTEELLEFFGPADDLAEESPIDLFGPWWE